MIYTITFNPALDYILQVEKFEKGKINRTITEKMLPGGKGLNVSTVLKNLGLESTALGFIGGFTGEELKKLIEVRKIKNEFITVKEGITRINIKINSDDETAINGNGPQIAEEDIEQLLSKIEKIPKESIVILSGNTPKNIDNHIYEKICKRLQERQITYVVDACKELLLNILKYEPFLIKPNREELEETFGIQIDTREQIIEYGRKLQEKGAQNVLVSLGGDGAILISRDGQEYSCKAPKGQVINTVGAGDSMVAGFIAEYIKTKNYEQSLKMGIATGSASAFSENLATKEEVEELLKKI